MVGKKAAGRKHEHFFNLFKPVTKINHQEIQANLVIAANQKNSFQFEPWKTNAKSIAFHEVSSSTKKVKLLTYFNLFFARVTRASA